MVRMGWGGVGGFWRGGICLGFSISWVLDGECNVSRLVDGCGVC